MMGLEIDESNDVSGPETVSVPAGKFEAMTTEVIQGSAPSDEDLWYAPPASAWSKSMTDTGSVKSTTELLEYSGK